MKFIYITELHIFTYEVIFNNKQKNCMGECGYFVKHDLLKSFQYLAILAMGLWG